MWNFAEKKQKRFFVTVMSFSATVSRAQVAADIRAFAFFGKLGGWEIGIGGQTVDFFFVFSAFISIRLLILYFSTAFHFVAQSSFFVLFLWQAKNRKNRE